jgi:hypothetical protein
LSFDNFDTNTSFGFEISSNYKITKWVFNLNFSSIKQKGLISVQNTNTNSFDLVQRGKCRAFNARLNSNFKATSVSYYWFYRSGVTEYNLTEKKCIK